MALKQNIIYIYFKGKHLVTSKSQYQYNHGQYLYFADLNLPQAFEVHFSNKDKGESKTQIGSNKLVEIPDEYFWSGASQIYAWVYLHSEINDGETIYEVRIPLIKRAKPTDEEPLPQQESVMERAIAELNNAVEITTENANKTEEDRTQVSNIKDEIIDLKENIDGTADTVNQKAQEAIDASVRSENSAQHAAEYESGAQNYSQQAEQSAQRALESESVARQKAQVATDASAEALGYRDEALDAKNKAEQAKQNIVDYRDETKGYRDETLNIKNDVQTLKGQIDETASDVSDISASVKADAQSASNSADDASQSANSADQSAESASLSESKARQSEINAYNSANDASQSAEQARQFKNQSETNVSHYPKVINGFWYVWDASNDEFKNTNVDARGLKGDKGDKGDTGNGIASTVLNSDYTLTITFTDGTTYKSQSIRGEKGLKGDKGDTGNGIASTVLNNDYTLTITFTDGTSYTTPSIRGQQGEKGDKGDVGESGVYIGADEPQDEDIKVWIDTDEAGTEADLIQDVVDLKEENKKIIANLATDTASGAVASFSDGADDLPLKSLIVDINPIQDLSHGDPSPENICPISGWTSVDVEQSGINLFDKATAVVGYIDDNSGQLKTQGLGQTSKATDYISVKPNASYYISSEQTRGAWGAWYDDDKNYISGITGYIATALDAQKTKIAPSNARYMRLTVEYNANDTNYGNVDTFSVNYPSTDHSYHPYTGRSITISLGQTVYGGKLDVLSGELVIDRAKRVLNGSETWSVIAYQNHYRAFSPSVSDIEPLTASAVKTKTVCDTFGSGTWNNVYVGMPVIGQNGIYLGFGLDVLGITTVEGVKAWLADNPITIAYPLATPIEIQLSANQINSLYGVNNIWADSGDTEVEYRADTSLYVKRKITEAIAALS